jgi:hypothetical protein
MPPKLTWNSAAVPAPVERTAWTLYVTVVTPAGRVLSRNFFLPAWPRKANGPVPSSWR